MRPRRSTIHGNGPDISSLNLDQGSKIGVPGKMRSASHGDHPDIVSPTLERQNSITPGSSGSGGGGITVLST